MNIDSEIEEFQSELSAIRRDVHAHPELGYAEFRTADVIAAKLSEWGIEVHRGLAGTGVVGTIKGSSNPRAIGLRADMDALPLSEQNAFEHRSRHDGKMHACGHDGHIAMLLGAAKYLSSHRDFDGAVHLIFQPAEEGNHAGARTMLREGLFEKFPCDAVFGMHNWPGLKSGNFAVRPGPIMASNNDFTITLEGKGAHAAMPHNGNDPLLAAVQIISALQSIITRNKKPIDSAVLSVTQFHGGTASNIIPNSVWFGGTVRTFTVEVLDLIEQRMKEIASSISFAFGCTVKVQFDRNYPPTINSEAETSIAIDAMRKTVDAKNVDTNVEPTMGAEDFAFMLQEKPGCYVFIGNGEGGHREGGHGLGPCSLHNPSYDFDDNILSIGSQYWVNLVQTWFDASR